MSATRRRVGTAAKRSYPFQPKPVRRVGPEDELLAAVGAEAAEILRIVERAHPGALAAVLASGEGPTLIHAGARLIDRVGSQHSDPAARKQDDLFAPLVTEMIAAVDPSHQELTRLSLTSPPGKDDRATVMGAARDLLARVRADGGARAGGVLARDRRDVNGDAGHHLYGLVAAERSARPMIRDAWIGLTGAAPAAVFHGAIGGWPRYAACGDASSLRRNLGMVARYAFHDLPRGEARDLDEDVVACGPLGDAWRAFRALGAVQGRSTPSERLPPMGISRSTGCAVCGGSLAGMRRDAETCSAACRKQKHNERKDRDASTRANASGEQR